MDDRDLLRIGILVAGALLMLAIWYFGSRKPVCIPKPSRIA